MGWYIIKANLGKRYWTAHKDPLCGTLIKPGSKFCRIPKHLVYITSIGVQTPCSMCDTLGYFNYQISRSEYFKNHPEKIFGYAKLKKQGLI